MSTSPDTVQLLAHMVKSTTSITRWTAGKTLKDYTQDPYLRSAVERQFIIIGEAMNMLRGVEPTVAACISHYKLVISFRNVLVHGFFQVDDSRVWDTISDNVPTLHREVSDLLAEYEEI